MTIVLDFSMQKIAFGYNFSISRGRLTILSPGFAFESMSPKFYTHANADKLGY